MAFKTLSTVGRIECGLDAVMNGRRFAFVAVMNNERGGKPYGLGAAVKDETGYYPIPSFWAWADTYEEASEMADVLNEAAGLDKRAAITIVARSMRKG